MAAWWGGERQGLVIVRDAVAPCLLPWGRVQFTPTVAHCSMATLIGLSIRVKLMRTLPARFKVDIKVCGSVGAAPSRDDGTRPPLLRTVRSRAHLSPQRLAKQVTPGSHSSEAAVNKQLADKERVAAALENPNLLDMVNRCVKSCLEATLGPLPLATPPLREVPCEHCDTPDLTTRSPEPSGMARCAHTQVPGVIRGGRRARGVELSCCWGRVQALVLTFSRQTSGGSR